MPKLFKFARPGRSTIARLPSARVPKLRDEEEAGPFYVRGQRAGSKEEYWVSLFLEWLEKTHGWGWDFQVPLYGGRRRRGGAVADFLVYTPGRWTLLDPMGRYWHTGRHEDQTQYEYIARQRNWRLIAWFTDRTPTKEATFAFLKNQFYV